LHGRIKLDIESHHMKPIPVNPDRLLAELAELRKFGAQGKGVARPAFSQPDIASRILLAERMRNAGLTVSIDACGNLFGIPPGDGPCLLIGSHSDSQPLGGWLDGIYGVLCGLEISRASFEAGGPRVAVVSFQDEEGRFGGLTGSAVWAGAISLEEADAMRATDGESFAEARRPVNVIAPIASVPPERFSAYLEAHIEQGPVLDKLNEAIGVVDAIVGMRGAKLRFVGQANHAGTTPMHMRRDALTAAAHFIRDLEDALAPHVTKKTVWTHGHLVVEPNAASIVPGVASLSVQMRDPESGRLDTMMRIALKLAHEIALERKLSLEVEQGASFEPVPMSEKLTAHIAAAAETHAAAGWRRMPSGALHDASNVARVLPVGMMFVPSINGISHNPDEDTAREHLVMGLLTLADAASRIMADHDSPNRDTLAPSLPD
jgi:N-carbamoyl-L-amino-acid hydrolase